MERMDQERARMWLSTAVAEARAGLAEAASPIAPRCTARTARFWPRPQPAGPGRWTLLHARGDVGVSWRCGTTAFVPRYHHGDDPSLVLVLLRPGRQFGISRVVVGEAETFHGGHDWLAEHGVEIVLLGRPRVRRADARLHQGQPGSVERGHW